ncbi:histidine phosphatase family protein [Listeria aquatica]|uniref:histidine phosphatase family protein n=1 Tax=Listeria aquatica TaxID=1494960 RepID=UPI003EF980EF
MASQSLRFYFVRHGKTEWNLSGQMQGWGDSPLVTEGKNGAIAVGEALRNVKFRNAYVSPSKRTQETAKYIIGSRKIPVQLMDDFREMGFGSWEGEYISDLDVRFKESRTEMLTSPATFDARENGGETFYELEKRVLRGVEQIIQQEKKGGNVLVVSHGMALTLLLYLLSGGEMSDHRTKGTRILNTSISVVEYQEGKFNILDLNNTDHLDSVRV